MIVVLHTPKAAFAHVFKIAIAVAERMGLNMEMSLPDLAHGDITVTELPGLEAYERMSTHVRAGEIHKYEVDLAVRSAPAWVDVIVRDLLTPPAPPPAPAPPSVVDVAVAAIKALVATGDLTNPRIARLVKRQIHLLPTLKQAFAASIEEEEAAMLVERPRAKPGSFQSYLGGGNLGLSPILGDSSAGGEIDPDLTDLPDSGTSFDGPQRNQAPNPVETFQSQVMREGMNALGALTKTLARQAAVQEASAKTDALAIELDALQAGQHDVARRARQLAEGTPTLSDVDRRSLSSKTTCGRCHKEFESDKPFIDPDGSDVCASCGTQPQNPTDTGFSGVSPAYDIGFSGAIPHVPSVPVEPVAGSLGKMGPEV